MERYANRSGNSGVVAYQIGTDYIWVQFTSGTIYEYTNSSAGSSNIETMKTYAQAGSGLCSFIKRYVNKGYSRQIR
ncbi:hypothetical protein HDF24_25175 [Mucilaginibacter sp. X4EP1]|jgi:hypothetical protein|uniref:hypothetical protein n=1 Tax=Mucilaginibacter sp. X4EP1 TaxID=2723092 RepID=UPI003AFFB3A1|nr:hypothetical protein [Mucilaginibacter sp. X4EP1]